MHCFKSPLLVLLICVWRLFMFHGASAQYMSNMSFEGTRGRDLSPEGWSTCTEFSTPDTQPGAWEVSTPPSDGQSYLGMVTRGNLGPFANRNEDAEARMLIRLIKGQTYNFKIDLAHSKDFGHNVDGEFLFYDTPAKLQVVGGAVQCDQREVLWESPPIDHEDWVTYHMDIVPQDVNVSYITLRAAHVGSSTYFGNVLVDNIRDCTMDLELLSDTVLCEGDSFVLSAFFEGANYLWHDGSTNASFRIDTTGVYSVTVANECVTKDFEIDVTTRNCVCDTALPIETTSFDTLVCDFSPVMVDARTPGGSYFWNDGTTVPRRTITTPGVYSVQVTNGCDVEVFEFDIQNETCTCELEIPNVFTPNGDGKNDTFEIEGTSGVLSYQLKIFDRNGSLVFESNYLANQWDGSGNGGKMLPGVYYWVLHYGCVYGVADAAESLRGTVTLLK